MAVNTDVGICHDTDEFNVANGGIIPDPLGKKPAGRGVSLIVDGVPIANFSTITSSGGEPETIDVTTHDTPGRYREERSSFSSPLEATFDVIYDPTHFSHMWLGYLFQTGKMVPVVVQIWNGVLDKAAEILFSGQVTAFPMPSFPIDGPYTMTVGIGGIKNIRFPGMDVAPPKPPIKYAVGGCPGVFLPVREKNEPETALPSSTDLATKGIRAFPSTTWGPSMRVETSDAKSMMWDGKAWAEILPLATSAKSDGTFAPAGSRPPATLAELRNLAADPTTDWKRSEKVTVDGKNYTYKGGKWVAWTAQPKATALDYTGAQPVWTKDGAPAAAPTTKAQLDNVTDVKPPAAGGWTNKKVTVGGTDYKWNGSAWVALTAPIVATGVDATTPEHKFTPGGATPPAKLSDLKAANITPSPTDPWGTGEFVTLGDNNSAYWAGPGGQQGWKTGKAP